MKNLTPRREFDQIKKIFESPENKAFISKAVRYENRLRFHGDIAMELSDVTRAANDFFDFVKAILPQDKFHVFLSLFTYPVYTTEVCQTVYNGLKKVFDGKNPFVQIEFSNPELTQKIEEYLDSIGGRDKWEEETWERMVSAINSIMVVDLERTPSAKAEPYYYFVDIGKVHDFKTCDDVSQLDYLAYFLTPSEFVFIDAHSYRVFPVTDSKLGLVPTIDNPHKIGYCPARFFWTDKLGYTSNMKAQPVSNQLGNLDWLLYFAVSKRAGELYGQYPIYWGYEQSCDYRDEQRHIYCDGGFIKSDSTSQYLLTGDMKVQRCPVCSGKRLNGAGSFVEVPWPDQERNERPVGAPVGIVTVDGESLKYNSEQLKSLEDKFITACVGIHKDIKNDQAFNEKQVMASYESRVAVLTQLKKNFEKAEEWIIETISRIMYGDLFKDVVVDYGTDFYLFTASELTMLYDSAKKSGASDIVLDNILYQLIETQNKHNPIELQRAQILVALEPLRHMTKAEASTYFGKAGVTEDDFILKLNFPNFIDRFEREQSSLVEFGSALSFDQKIKSINKILMKYVGEHKTATAGQREPAGEPKPGAEGQPAPEGGKGGSGESSKDGESGKSGDPEEK